MHYEINVSLNGQHFFATAERSLTTESRAREVYAELVFRFPRISGYRVTVTRHEETGTEIDTVGNGWGMCHNQICVAPAPVPAVVATAVTIDLTEWKRSHGFLPRGRGGWIFAFGNPDDQSTWRNFNGPYLAAKRAAVAAARKEGVVTIHLMP